MSNADRPTENSQLEQAVAARTCRRMKAQREGDRGVWFGLGMFGLIGWSITVPTLLGAALGVWIDSRTDGPHSWTLMLLLLGVGLGCVNAWLWISRETQDIEEAEERTNESLDV